jgi:hypothetical protein
MELLQLSTNCLVLSFIRAYVFVFFLSFPCAYFVIGLWAAD